MKKRSEFGALLRFAAPSILGVAVFLVPFSLHGNMNTLLGHMKEALLSFFAGRQPLIAAAVTTTGAALAIAAKFFTPPWIVRDEILHENLTGGALWFFARVLAMPIALSVWLVGAERASELGPVASAFISEASFIAYNMTPRLVALAIVLGILSPLVMDFGLVQFIAVYANPVMRPLFRVPGRSAVDCVASWLGSSSMAVVLTAKMYNSGHYTGREAAAVVCGFSLAGIYNIYAMAELIDIDYAMPQILIVSYSVMFLLAYILPRVAPLSTIPDVYVNGRVRRPRRYGWRRHWRRFRRGKHLFRWALLRGMIQARRMNVARYMHESRSIIFSLVFSTVPLMITFGTLLLLIAEFTPFARIIGAPFEMLFAKLGAFESEIIAASSIFAFVDQYLAVAAGRALLTAGGRFSCVCIAVVGLVNLTEVGLHVWHSNIPLKFWQMAAVYAIRIAVAAVIVIPTAEILFN